MARLRGSQSETIILERSKECGGKRLESSKARQRGPFTGVLGPAPGPPFSLAAVFGLAVAMNVRRFHRFSEEHRLLLEEIENQQE